VNGNTALSLMLAFTAVLGYVIGKRRGRPVLGLLLGFVRVLSDRSLSRHECASAMFRVVPLQASLVEMPTSRWSWFANVSD
jgi:hypothetical protein